MQSNCTATSRCKICEQVLPICHFYLLLNRNGKRYPNSYCKDCGNKNRNHYGKSAPTKQMIRRRNLKIFGMTVEQYDALLASQGGVCAICHSEETHVSPFTKSARRLCVDHDHQTGEVRGLLCSACNRAIGLLGDSLPRILAVVDYLKSKTT